MTDRPTTTPAVIYATPRNYARLCTYYPEAIILLPWVMTSEALENERLWKEWWATHGK